MSSHANFMLQRSLLQNPQWRAEILSNEQLNLLPKEKPMDIPVLIFNNGTGIFVHLIHLNYKIPTSYFRCYVDFTNEVFGIIIQYDG
jgi:hypothetical protein